MRVLAIETSCDETAIAIVDGQELPRGGTSFRVLGNALLSQIEIHKPYGGVFPALAKREHAKNLVPILEAALEEAELLRGDTRALAPETRAALAQLLEREPGLSEKLFEFVSECETPDIDAIAVTAGPGLEPALWVGVSFAKALALVWNKPLVGVNHMEGHILAGLAKEPPNGSVNTSPFSTRFNLVISGVEMPVLALLISGGHTELVLMRSWLQYEFVGQTRDDAVGEAFDKVARMLELPYPGGPEISKLAEELRSSAGRRRLGTVSEGAEDQRHEENPFVLPRPMIHDNSCDFSFAGLKTAVLNVLKQREGVSACDRQLIAREFEDAVADVLWTKTARALDQTGASTLVIGGGVSANIHIKRVFRAAVAREYPHVDLRIPSATLTTDNAVMIGFAGYCRALRKDFAGPATLVASGNQSLA